MCVSVVRYVGYVYDIYLPLCVCVVVCGVCAWWVCVLFGVCGVV